MVYEHFLEFTRLERVKRRILECLKNCQLESAEFERMLRSYLHKPQEFILCNEKTGAWKRNNVISIYQLLRDLPIPHPVSGIKITFYSSGTSISQGDSLGHFDINVDDLALRIDPGPNGLASALNIYKLSRGKAGNDPLWLDGILLTHIHSDHTGGFQEVFERMRWGGLIDSTDKFVIGNHTCIDGNKDFDCGPLLDKYKKCAVRALALEPGMSVKIKDVEIKATYAKHVEAVDGNRRLEDSCIGYKIITSHGVIGITGDTEWHPRLVEDFAGADLIIAYITQEAERAGTRTQKDYGLTDPGQFHRQFLGELGVAELTKHLKPPKGVILTDFGDQLKSLSGDYDIIPGMMAARLQAEVGIIIPIKAATPGMVMHMDRSSLSFEYW